MNDANPEVPAVARLAFDRFSQGLKTGEWQPFLDLLADDFSFWFPVGEFQGENVGKERAAAFFGYVSSIFDGGLSLTLTGVTYNESTVVFEFRDEGTLRGQPYRNRGAVAFDVRGDRIIAYREYLAIVVVPRQA